MKLDTTPFTLDDIIWWAGQLMINEQADNAVDALYEAAADLLESPYGHWLHAADRLMELLGFDSNGRHVPTVVDRVVVPVAGPASVGHMMQHLVTGKAR